MTEIAVLQKQADGKITLDCTLHDGRYHRYKFDDLRSLLSFTRYMTKMLWENLSILAEAENPDLLNKSEYLHVTIGRIMSFIEATYPHSRWSHKLSKEILSILEGKDNG